jgi:hypothetical protein
MISRFLLRLVGALTAAACLPMSADAAEVSADNALQALVDANAGQVIMLKGGEYRLTRALRITQDSTELVGPARIVQTDEKESIVTITGAKHVRLADLSFTRSAGHQEAEEAGIEVQNCSDLELSHVRVSDNHSHTSIRVRASRDVTVSGCTITNYKGLAIDDRTANAELYGFAFRSIDGTGIQMMEVEGVVIRDNRIQEYRFWPTKELRDQYNLGALTVIPRQRGRLMDQDIFDSHYTNNWHQGAAIQVTSPEKTRRVLITGNYIEHPAQGLDLHCDQVIVTNNLISYAMIGMKAMHGAKNVLIDGNQFTNCDLWGVLLMPGAASHASGVPGKPAENTDGGTVVSNNIFSNFGFGDQYWNWVNHHNDVPERNVIALLGGQLAENPPIRNLLITGNVVYDSGRDTVLLDGKWVPAPPRYHYALYVEQQKQPIPVNVHASGNLFDAGMDGTVNATLPP